MKVIKQYDPNWNFEKSKRDDRTATTGSTFDPNERFYKGNYVLYARFLTRSAAEQRHCEKYQNFFEMDVIKPRIFGKTLTTDEQIGASVASRKVHPTIVCSR